MVCGLAARAGAANLATRLPLLHQPWGRGHTTTRRRGTWCNDRAGHRRCTIPAWWDERRTDPWFVITMRVLNRAARPAHDRGGAAHCDHAPPAVPRPQAFSYANTGTLLSTPRSCLRVAPLAALQRQQTWQHCNAHVPLLSTTGASGFDVASAPPFDVFHGSW